MFEVKTKYKIHCKQKVNRIKIQKFWSVNYFYVLEQHLAGHRPEFSTVLKVIMTGRIIDISYIYLQVDALFQPLF